MSDGGWRWLAKRQEEKIEELEKQAEDAEAETEKAKAEADELVVSMGERLQQIAVLKRERDCLLKGLERAAHDLRHLASWQSNSWLDMLHTAEKAYDRVDQTLGEYDEQ